VAPPSTATLVQSLTGVPPCAGDVLTLLLDGVYAGTSGVEEIHVHYGAGVGSVRTVAGRRGAHDKDPRVTVSLSTRKRPLPGPVIGFVVGPHRHVAGGAAGYGIEAAAQSAA